MPGLIELHTDHLEAHFEPRPKVYWDPIAAVVSYDSQLATSGITTVLDSLRVGRDDDIRDHGMAEAITYGTRCRAVAVGSFPASALRNTDAQHAR